MNIFSPEAEQIMIERFGKDTIIALATTEKETPYVRYVNAYYENGAFYIITYALSNKMKHIKINPVVAIAGEWFTAHGKGVTLVLQRTLIALFKYPPVFDIIKGGGYYDDKYSIRPTAIRTVGS